MRAPRLVKIACFGIEPGAVSLLIVATDFHLIRGDERNELLAAQPLAGGNA